MPLETTLAPWLTVQGNGAVAFYKEAFGATEAYRMEIPGGGLVARLVIAPSASFWVSEEPAAGGAVRPAMPQSVRMIVTVDTPDRVFERAIAAGATEVFPVGEEHGWRLGRLKDPYGFEWEIGHELAPAADQP